MPQQYGLGRGLSSLIPPKDPSSTPKTPSNDTSSSGHAGGEDRYAPKKASVKKSSREDKDLPQKDDKDVRGLEEVEIGKVKANTHQPRMTFNEQKLRELADSIKKHGIIQPLVVVRSEEGYELIAGERRLRAARIAGLTKVPITVRASDKQEKFELAILENIQRHDLSPIEEARAYRRLIDEFDLSQEDVALRLGKSRSAVANSVRFLELPVEIQRGLEDGSITPGHAKIILSLENSEKQRALFDTIVRSELTVRQAESRVRSLDIHKQASRSSSQDPQLKDSEDELSEKVGTKVQVKKMGQGAKVVIEFYSKQDLAGFLNKL